MQLESVDFKMMTHSKPTDTGLKTPENGFEAAESSWSKSDAVGHAVENFSSFVGDDPRGQAMMPPFDCGMVDMEFLPAGGSGGGDGSPAQKRARSPELKTEQVDVDPVDGLYKPLRAGLRNRNRKVVTKFDDDSSEDYDPPAKSRSSAGKRKRSPSIKINTAEFKLEGSNRQEKPLPPDLDEKQTRRILRNRASAERSRLRRLCKITALEQENTELRRQVESRQVESRNNERKPNGGGPLAEDIEHSNRQLRAELQLMRDRVSTLTSLLSRHSSS